MKNTSPPKQTNTTQKAREPMETFSFSPDAADFGKRADVYLTEQFDSVSRSAIQQLMEQGAVRVNGTCCTKKKLVAEGDVFLVDIPAPHAIDAQPENLPLDVVYEDDDLLVVNKAKGMCVHPAPGNETGTLVNALLYHCGTSLSGINGAIRPGIVHRIDKDTSGLLIVAKNDRSHATLAEQISAHRFDRRYEAVVFGSFPDPSGSIVLPVGRSDRDRKKMAVSEKGRYAKTDYQTLASYSSHGVTYSHLALTLFTGRTHQIRVHCAAKGHPVAGDPVYGNAERDRRWFPSLFGQCLHAGHIGFTHPTTGQFLEFDAPVPDSFQEVLTKLASWTKIL